MKIDVIDFLILGSATWRMASLLVNEKGPFDVFLRLRKAAGIEEMRLDDKPEIYKAVPDTFLAGVLDCVWCCSVWAGLGATVLYFLAPQITIWLSLPLALSAAAVTIEGFARR